MLSSCAPVDCQVLSGLALMLCIAAGSWPTVVATWPRMVWALVRYALSAGSVPVADAEACG